MTMTPQSNLVLGLDGVVYKLDSVINGKAPQPVQDLGKMSPQTCLLESETGEVYNILDLLSGQKVALTPEQLKGYSMSPRSGLAEDVDGNVISLIDAYSQAGAVITGRAWLPIITPQGQLSWKEFEVGDVPPGPVNIKGPAGRSIIIYDTSFDYHTTAQIENFAIHGHRESFDKSQILFSPVSKVGDIIGLNIQNSDTGYPSIYLGEVSEVTQQSVVCLGRGALHSGLKGEKGDKGDRGPAGPKGDAGSNFGKVVLMNVEPQGEKMKLITFIEPTYWTQIKDNFSSIKAISLSGEFNINESLITSMVEEPHTCGPENYVGVVMVTGNLNFTYNNQTTYLVENDHMISNMANI